MGHLNKLFRFILLFSVALNKLYSLQQPTTYNLLDFSQLRLVRTVSEQPYGRNRFCSRKGYDYQCSNSVFKNDAEFEQAIRNDDIWQLEFDNVTKGYDIQISFRKPYVVQTFLLTFLKAMNISAGSIEVTKTNGHTLTTNFASSELICKIIFDPEYENCQVTNLTAAWKFIFPEPIVARRFVIHLYPPVVDTYQPKPSYIINHLKIYGECWCASGRLSRCITAREESYHSRVKRSVLVCSSDVWSLPYNYFIYKRRRRRDACTCSKVGTLYGICSPVFGVGNQCPCKVNYKGLTCNQCFDGYYDYPTCKACSCNFIGSKSSTCNQKTGKCECELKYTGEKCNQCAPGRYNFPFCYPCPCPVERTKPDVCDAVSGSCHCQERYEGHTCTSCKKWLINYPSCHRPGCQCSVTGSVNGTCNDRNQCYCKKKYIGKRCDQCKPGYGNFPTCSACQCDVVGSYDNNCDARNGQCRCKPLFTGKNCDRCADEALNFPLCSRNQNCTCHPSGTKIDKNTKGICIKGVSCICKENVESSDCSKCKQNHYNIASSNTKGCSACNCHREGTFGDLGNCDEKTGQCICKASVTGRRCDKCKDGFYSLNKWDLFGCEACNCDIGGAVSPNCDDSGYCQCKENFEGKKCNKLKQGDIYVSDYYHNKYEVELGTKSGVPVNYLFNSNHFPHYTGPGYVAFDKKEKSLKMQIRVPKIRRYMMIVRYKVTNEEKASILLLFNSQDRKQSYVSVVDFVNNYNGEPNYNLIYLQKDQKDIVMTQGTWELELTAISTNVLLDHVVLVPKEYFTADKLQPDHVSPCVARQQKGTICADYKYIDLKKFYIVQAETGTNSKGYGNEIVKKTQLFEDMIILQQLPVINNMAMFSANQIALTLAITVQEKGVYYVVVKYYNPDDRTYRLDLYDGESGSRGYMEAIPCPYRFLCRAVILEDPGKPYLVSYDVNRTSEITFLGNIQGTLAIDYVALIPKKDWSPNYITPGELCYTKDKVCLQNIVFRRPDDSISVPPTKENPENPLINAVYGTSEKSLFFEASLTKKSKYVLVYQFYQPNYPSFNAHVRLLHKGVVESMGDVTIQYCPSNIGCRGTYINGELDGNVTVQLEVPRGKEIWIDSVFLIPEESYEKDVLIPKRTELTQKFKRSCLLPNGLPKHPPPEGFCMEALITLTSEFTSQTYRCSCDIQGSTSTQCARIGGACSCKKGVVGKNCDKCRTGYYGFPNCKPCKCFTDGSLNADCSKFGQCSCKANFTGLKCDQCVPSHWGFPNCLACDCDRQGSFSLRCRGSDGQCPCLYNYAGRKCNRCQVGNFDFPYCRSCNCHSSGILVSDEAPTGCYRNNPDRCECKPNVHGETCDKCKEHFYNLQLENPVGCSPCDCSSFGTVRGAGPCDKRTGQCICQPNVMGRRCDACKDGYYVVKKDRVFTCQPCLCSSGGSVTDICDKESGQCKCKPHVGGLKCNETREGGYYLPSLGQYIFTVDQIVPYARKIKNGRFEGAAVNGSFATIRLNLEVKQPQQSFYIMIYYALASKLSPRIDLEFYNEDTDRYIPITEYLKSRSFRQPSLEILRRNNTYFKLLLTKGSWNLQVLFYDTILLNQITLVPTGHFGTKKVTKSIHNPCTVFDGKKYCSMYTYYKITSPDFIAIEGENKSGYYGGDFDLQKYKGANINGAVLLVKEKAFGKKKKFSGLELQEHFYLVLQYVNTGNKSVIVEVTIETTEGSQKQKGSIELVPCIYAFGCRQVVLMVHSSVKVLFEKGGMDKIFTVKILKGENTAYLDYMLLVPRSKWSPNIISPSFYCLRRLSRCIEGEFLMPPHSLFLDASKALRVITSVPPESHVTTKAVMVSSRRQRNLRWLSPLKSGNYYMLIQYYQPMKDSFLAKIIVMTYQRAVAGKIKFNYCPSVHGCRAVVQYFVKDEKQIFSINGNILRVSLTLPRQTRLWVEKVILVQPREFKESTLEISPLDLTKRYLRKCAGRPYDQVDKANKKFCLIATFELTLGLDQYPKKCECNKIGTVSDTLCDPTNGQCECKLGFRGKSCSMCTSGKFPKCVVKKRYFKFDWSR